MAMGLQPVEVQCKWRCSSAKMANKPRRNGMGASVDSGIPPGKQFNRLQLVIRQRE